MLLQSLSALAWMVALAAANSVAFVSLDDINRTIFFTPSVGHEGIDPVWIPARSTMRVEIPWAWIGNWYSVSEGRPNVPGMLGEVTFQGWSDLTYFDVSAIVNPNDHEGVNEMYPAQTAAYRSGCAPFPCNNAYYLPNDLQTKTTKETDLICTLGAGYVARRSAEEEAESLEAPENVGRNFVLGKLF